MSNEFDNLDFSPYELSELDIDHMEWSEEADAILKLVADQLARLGRFELIAYNEEFRVIRLMAKGNSSYWRWGDEAMTEILSAFLEAIEFEAEREAVYGGSEA